MDAAYLIRSCPEAGERAGSRLGRPAERAAEWPAAAERQAAKPASNQLAESVGERPANLSGAPDAPQPAAVSDSPSLQQSAENVQETEADTDQNVGPDQVKNVNNVDNEINVQSSDKSEKNRQAEKKKGKKNKDSVSQSVDS